MHQPVPRLAFPALILANLFLAAGPWMVRLADVGPVAAGFWRLALAAPVLAYVGLRQSAGKPFAGWAMIAAIAGGGLFFAADLAAWHEGILRTKLANATLFGNFASFLFAIYGFFLLRSLPRPVQGLALLLAGAGAALLLGNSYELSRANFTGDLLALLAGLFYTFYLIAVDRARRAMAPFPGARHRHHRGHGAAPPVRADAWRAGGAARLDAGDPALDLEPADRPGPAGLMRWAMSRRWSWACAS